MLETKTGVSTMFKWLCPKKINVQEYEQQQQKRCQCSKILHAASFNIFIFSSSCSHGIKSRSQTYFEPQGRDSAQQPLLCKHLLSSRLIEGWNKNSTICSFLPNSNIQLMSDCESGLWLKACSSRILCVLKTSRPSQLHALAFFMSEFTNA